MGKVEGFTLHNESGQSVLDSELKSWIGPKGEFIFGPATKYTWTVDGANYSIQRPDRQTWHMLPDATGFICFEHEWNPNNCLLLDVYGKERMRLTVPWQLTIPQNPSSAMPPTSFAGIGTPCINPLDGKKGRFGLEAWVEHAGRYYFELDYHTGQFLWGREIRD